MDKIVAKLSPVELEQVVKIIGRSPRGYPPGAYDALKGKRNLASPQPPTARLSPNVAPKPSRPAAHTNPDTERRILTRRFTAPEVPTSERGAATTVLARGLRIGGSGSGGAVYGLSSFRSAPGSLAKFTAIPSDLSDRIASVLLLLLLFGKQIDYLLSV